MPSKELSFRKKPRDVAVFCDFLPSSKNKIQLLFRKLREIKVSQFADTFLVKSKCITENRKGIFTREIKMVKKTTLFEKSNFCPKIQF